MPKKYSDSADSASLHLSNNFVDAFCLEWVQWCATRRFYVRPTSKGMLARLQPSKTKEEPNIRNSPEMSFFNVAVHSMADMDDQAEGYACFKAKYLEVHELIKVQVAALGISRPTYYSRARAFARKAILLSKSLKRAHDEMATKSNDDSLVE